MSLYESDREKMARLERENAGLTRIVASEAAPQERGEAIVVLDCSRCDQFEVPASKLTSWTECPSCGDRDYWSVVGVLAALRETPAPLVPRLTPVAWIDGIPVYAGEGDWHQLSDDSLEDLSTRIEAVLRQRGVEFAPCPKCAREAPAEDHRARALEEAVRDADYLDMGNYVEITSERWEAILRALAEDHAAPGGGDVSALVCTGQNLTAANHCWHHTNTTLTSNPPQHVEQCCYCGMTRAQAAPRITFTGHGPYAPNGDG